MSMADTAAGGAMDGNDAMPSAEAMAAVIARLLQKYGRGLIGDRRRMLGLLRDHEPTQVLAIRLVMGAYDQDVPQIFLAGDAAQANFAIDRAVQTLTQATGIRPDLAQWSVACWQKALAVLAEPVAAPVIEPVAASAPEPVIPVAPTPSPVDPVTLPVGDARMPEPEPIPEPSPEPEPLAAAPSIAAAGPASVAAPTPPAEPAVAAESSKPPAESLTWGDSVVAAPPTPPAPAAPPAAPTVAPSVAAAVPPAPAAAAAPPSAPMAPPAIAPIAPPPPLAVAPVAPPPAAPPPVVAAPVADMTWGESEVLAPAPVPPPAPAVAPLAVAPSVASAAQPAPVPLPMAPLAMAPAAAIPVAPAFAPSVPQPMAAAPGAPPPPGYVPGPGYAPGPGPMPGPVTGMPRASAPNFLNVQTMGLIITGVVIAVGAAVYRFDLLGPHFGGPTTPTTTAPAPQQPAPQAPAPAQDPLANIPLIKVLTNASDIDSWPRFAAGTRIGNTANSWQFKFNMKYPDGRLFVYTASFMFASNNLREGKGVISAVDLRQNTEDMVSQTPALPIVRARQGTGKSYLTSIQTTSWDQNPANAPGVCISFTSGSSASRFEPEQSLFCVNDYKNHACGVELGCGRLD